MKSDRKDTSWQKEKTPHNILLLLLYWYLLLISKYECFCKSQATMSALKVAEGWTTVLWKIFQFVSIFPKIILWTHYFCVFPRILTWFIPSSWCGEKTLLLLRVYVILNHYVPPIYASGLYCAWTKDRQYLFGLCLQWLGRDWQAGVKSLYCCPT